MFPVPVFTDDDNETQVREFLVAPLLSHLGFREADIETEFNILSRFGGTRKPLRADYVISVPNAFDLPPNRIVVEVKRPTTAITAEEVVEQALIYGAHPSIQASHVVITNGRKLAIFSISGTVVEPIAALDVARLPDDWEGIQAVLGADAIACEFAGVRVQRLLGAGGYGRVYEVVHPGLRRTEALKVLQAGAEQVERMRDRFATGAIGLAALDHPYICRVYTIGVHRGRPYYRMEYIPGTSVTEYVTQRGLSMEDRIGLIGKILSGLAYAHQHGVVHCDLKPSNVLVCADGTPKIIDFDFCHIGAQASVTLSQVVATIAYMDPTIWADARHRDPLADVYSCGLLLWSVISGRDLLPGWTPHALHDGLAGGAQAYLPLILRCIQQNRSTRPSGIEALLEDLHFAGGRAMPRDASKLVHGAVASFGVNSPINEFGFRFRLWEQTDDLPGSVDFDNLITTLPDRALSDREREFVFRATTLHWSIRYRYVFKAWPTTALLHAAALVLDDRDLNRAHKSKPGQSHPARHAIDLLGATDEYRDNGDSQRVGEFLLQRLPLESRPSVFFHCLDTLPRLQIMKGRQSDFRLACTKVLLGLVGERAAKANASRMREVGKILEKLDPLKCGMHSSDTVALLRNLCTIPRLRDKALATLSSIDHPDATDLFLELLDATKGQPGFEKIALMAIGIEGRYKRRVVAEYLRHRPDQLSTRVQTAVEELLADH